MLAFQTLHVKLEALDKRWVGLEDRLNLVPPGSQRTDLRSPWSWVKAAVQDLGQADKKEVVEMCSQLLELQDERQRLSGTWIEGEPAQKASLKNDKAWLLMDRARARAAKEELAM